MKIQTLFKIIIMNTFGNIFSEMYKIKPSDYLILFIMRHFYDLWLYLLLTYV